MDNNCVAVIEHLHEESVNIIKTLKEMTRDLGNTACVFKAFLVQNDSAISEKGKAAIDACDRCIDAVSVLLNSSKESDIINFFLMLISLSKTLDDRLIEYGLK